MAGPQRSQYPSRKMTWAGSTVLSFMPKTTSVQANRTCIRGCAPNRTCTTKFGYASRPGHESMTSDKVPINNRVVIAFAVSSLVLAFVLYLGDRIAPQSLLRLNKASSVKLNLATNCTSLRSVAHEEFSVFEQQISRDLSPFTDGIRKEDLDAAYLIHPALFRVLIHNNLLYVKTRSEYYTSQFEIGKPHAIMYALLKLLCRYQLPDVEFVLSIADSPQLHKSAKPLPLFSWSVSPAHWDVAFPYWSFSWLPAEFTKMTFNESAWRQREDKAVWRGSTTGGMYNMTNWFTKGRSILVDKCSKRPDLCDAHFTGYVQIDGLTRSTMLQKFGNHSRQSLQDQVQKYKYVVVVDGNGPPSSRIVSVMSSGAVVLWQETEKREFFYSALRPYVHYLPVSRNLDDLYTIIEWAQNHPVECENIARQAVFFANTYFRTDFASFYLRRLFKEYAALQNFTPHVSPGYKQVNLQAGIHKGVAQHAGGSCEYWTNNLSN